MGSVRATWALAWVRMPDLDRTGAKSLADLGQVLARTGTKSAKDMGQVLARTFGA